MGCVLSCLEPCAPCLFGCFVGCTPITWRVPPLDREGRRTVCLTIDDFPSKSLTVEAFKELLVVLDEHDALVTFFVILDNVKAHPYGEEMLRILCAYTEHELGCHWKGRWGCCMPTHEFVRSAFEFKGIQRRYGTHIRFCRPPGGFATSRTVVALNQQAGLKMVLGTAYPGDADICASRSPRWIGEMASNMAKNGGRIVILHCDGSIVAKVKHFLENAEFVGLAPSRTLSLATTGYSSGLGGEQRPIPALLLV